MPMKDVVMIEAAVVIEMIEGSFFYFKYCSIWLRAQLIQVCLQLFLFLALKFSLSCPWFQTSQHGQSYYAQFMFKTQKTIYHAPVV
jgi:hypothetical protein